jgi:hypothetical protein
MEPTKVLGAPGRWVSSTLDWGLPLEREGRGKLLHFWNTGMPSTWILEEAVAWVQFAFQDGDDDAGGRIKNNAIDFLLIRRREASNNLKKKSECTQEVLSKWNLRLSGYALQKALSRKGSVDQRCSSNRNAFRKEETLCKQTHPLFKTTKIKGKKTLFPLHPGSKTPGVHRQGAGGDIQQWVNAPHYPQQTLFFFEQQKSKKFLVCTIFRTL